MENKQRKQNYIDTRVQGALLRRILLHWFIFFLVAGLAVVIMQALLGDPVKTLADRVSEKAADVTILGIVLLAIFPAFLLDTVRFSNRFVGPIVRLRRQLRELADNNGTQHISFRDNDFWAQMADEMNKVTDLVKAQKDEIAQLKHQLTSSHDVAV